MAYAGNGAVQYRKDGRKAWIHLNRPEAMNAINGDLAEGVLRITRLGRNAPAEYSEFLAEQCSEAIGKSEDRVEGPRAFAEKRPPNWKGR